MKILICLLLNCCSVILFSQTGLVGEYYNGINFEQKVLTRTDAKIDFDWGFSGPKKGTVDDSYYSVRWTGKILAPESGEYIFSAKFDDGIRLWVNDVPMLNAWDLHDMGDFSNKITLEANKIYSIKLEYFNAMREGEITLLWQKPSSIKNGGKKYEPVSDKYLFQPNVEIKPPTPPIIATKNVIPKIIPTKIPDAKPKTKTIPPAVKIEKKDENTPISFEKMDKNLDIKQVFFIRSVNKMTDNSVERLDKVVLFLKNKPSAKIELNGHTDVMGDVKMNLELSINRAKLVADYLISKGILENCITFQGFGGTQPIVANPQTEEERAINRRVEFIVK